MNLIDLAIIGVLVISVIFGLYKGFLKSVLNIAVFLLSWGVALLFYKQFASWLSLNTPLADWITYLVDGSFSSLTPEIAQVGIDQIPLDQVGQLISQAKLPAPLDSMLLENVRGLSFSGMGLNTLSEYFNQTVLNLVMGTVSFIILVVSSTLILSIIAACVASVVRLPVLRQLDMVLGGVIGLVYGLGILFILFTLLPFVQLMLPADFLTPYVEGSKFMPFFSDHNFFLGALQHYVA